jgi:DNA-binding winged helix-turn-helix (wHTH) protein/TolB-like protein
MRDQKDDAEAVGSAEDATRRPLTGGALYEFGPFLLRLSDRTLFRGQVRVRITARVLDLLVCLVEESGRVVTKERLLERVWEGTFVEEGNVNRTVSTLRRLLEETEETPYVETIPRQGYRFVAPVRHRTEKAPMPPGDEVASPPVPTVESLPARKTTAEAPSPPKTPEVPTPASPSSSWRQLAATAAAVVLLLAAGTGAWSHARTREVPRSLAVLPFRFAAGAANGETLGVALADAVISRLSRTGSLVVRPTTAVLPFRAGKTDPVDAAVRLDVDAVLDAEVSQSGGRTRVSLRLLRRHGSKPL